jgi:hypothetical protein
MEREFVPYYEALALEELGFDEPCFYQYVRDSGDDGELIPIMSETNYPTIRDNNEVFICSGGDCFAAPIYQQVFRWFRETYKLDSYIKPATLKTEKVYDFYIWFTDGKGDEDLFIGMNNEYSYEEAQLECVIKLLEIVENV